VLAEVQEFARRRPGAFLAVALASGFVVGRLGRGVLGAAADTGAGTTSPSETYALPTQPGPPTMETVPPAQPGYAQPGYGQPTYPQPTPGYSTPVPPGYDQDVAVGSAPPPPTSYVDPLVDPELDERYRSGGTP
jgi:hypothetical protein